MKILSLVVLSAVAIVACQVTEVGSYPCPDAAECTPPSPTTGHGGVGGPCQTSDDCGGNSCVTAALLQSFGVNTTNITIPNGSCSILYCSSDAECGDAGVCANGAPFGAPTVTLCLHECANPSNCRWKEGYSCWVQDPATDPTGVCLPLSVIAAIYCQAGCP